LAIEDASLKPPSTEEVELEGLNQSLLEVRTLLLVLFLLLLVLPLVLRLERLLLLLLVLTSRALQAGQEVASTATAHGATKDTHTDALSLVEQQNNELVRHKDPCCKFLKKIPAVYP